MAVLQGRLSVEKKRVVSRAAAEPLRVPKVSLETTQKLCLSASRDAGTPWCWDGAVHGGAARVAERRKRRCRLCSRAGSSRRTIGATRGATEATKGFERPSKAVSEARGCQKAVSDGHKNRVHEVRWRETPSEVVSEALLEALRGVRSLWPKTVSDGHKHRVRPRHEVRWRERPSKAVSEALLEVLRGVIRSQKAVSDGHKNRVHEVRWRERPSKAVHEALLEALRGVRSL